MNKRQLTYQTDNTFTAKETHLSKVCVHCSIETRQWRISVTIAACSENENAYPFFVFKRVASNAAPANDEEVGII